MTIAFVLGNGTSIGILELPKFGKIYACNAVYREFDSDYPVAVDTQKMVNEIVHNGYLQHKGEVWTNYNKTYERFSGLHYFTSAKGGVVVPTALDMCSSRGHDSIYILGFDFKGIGPQ